MEHSRFYDQWCSYTYISQNAKEAIQTRLDLSGPQWTFLENSNSKILVRIFFSFKSCYLILIYSTCLNGVLIILELFDYLQVYD